MKHTIRAAIILLFGLACSSAYGWLRPFYEDLVVVQRSELIVVGHLERGSVVNTHPGGGYGQYRATLVITEAVKGVKEQDEIPIIIYYGLTPVIGGHIDEDGMKMDLRSLRERIREDSIEIIDTGSSALSFTPIVPDAGDDNLWFLRRRAGIDGRSAGTGDFGIVDPQDVQPLSLKDYFLAYMSSDPESGVRKQLSLHPEIARGAQRYLDHLEVQRILGIPEPEARIERLLPFYINGQSWTGEIKTRVDEVQDSREARRGILRCGRSSAKYLKRLFEDPELEQLKEDVIEIFGEMRWKDCVEPLIALLHKHDGFWSQQALEEGWWNRDSQSELTTTRRRIYGEVYRSVIALGKIGDRRAIDAIQLTRERWEAINFENTQIVEECDKALKLLKKNAATREPVRDKTRVSKDRQSVR